jgi:hypothetical protein
MEETMANDPVIAALEDQVGCYRRLAKLAEIQHEHVQNSATDQLLDVLSRRQEVLDQVADLEQIISPAKRQWSDYLGKLAADERSSAENLLAETRRLLETITTADRNDTMVLQARKLSLGRQINQATAARSLNRNYAAAAYGKRPARMDLTS